MDNLYILIRTSPCKIHIFHELAQHLFKVNEMDYSSPDAVIDEFINISSRKLYSLHE